ncbi:MAG: hypothetical protein HY064_17340 [Bacteroidetes bacterium]|nr:hypothetical protein [Bacteroidota bacterium]
MIIPQKNFTILFFILFFFPGTRILFSQIHSDSSSIHFPRILSTPTELSKIDSFPEDSSLYVISALNFSGNKKTKQFVLEREMTFHAGDTIRGYELQQRAERSRQNLLNTSLFNFVNIYYACSRDTSAVPCHSMNITVNVKERWYFWPAPIFDVYEQNVNTWYRDGHNLDRASYGFFLWKYNFRGRKESVALICRFGYSKQFGGQYAIPYLNKKGTLGVTLTGTYTRNHEVAYETRNNNFVYYKDKENYLRTETAGSVLFAYRKGLYVRQTLETKYTLLSVRDTVLDLQPDFFVGGKSRMEYFSLSYHCVRDVRDIKAYPLKGNYEEIEFTKHGMGILPDEKLNLFLIAGSVRWYGELFHRVYGAAMIRGRWLPGVVPPYYHQRAMGFGPFIRGYEYYVIDGQSFGLAKMSVRYELLKPHIYRFDFLPIEKFNTFHLAVYPGIYCDAGYVFDHVSVQSDHNFLGNTLLLGYGAGIDLVTYYDIAIRLEYTFNRLGENGFFLHMGTAF